MTFEHLINTTYVLDDGKGHAPRRVHLFDQRELEAIEAALLTQRPLLLRGEPGVGKSQLAEAFASSQDWELFRETLDANTDPNDLKWYEDSVERLAKAQFAGSLQAYQDAKQLETDLARQKFIRPGVLWQAFEATEPCVVLIDEIDKADVSVPNALLEALGSGRFKPTGDLPEVVAQRWPLVILTTNEERPLPPAFLRRCLVLNMDPPPMKLEGDGKTMRAWLLERGKAVHGEAQIEFLGQVADAVLEDRERAKRARLEPLPGLAEYLDLLRILFAKGVDDPKAAQKNLEKFKDFVLKKHRD